MHRTVFALAALALVGSALLIHARPDTAKAAPWRADRHQAVVTGPAGEETMEVYGFSHEVVSPRDAASGLPTGKRQHKPFSVTKPADKATGMLLSTMLAKLKPSP